MPKRMYKSPSRRRYKAARKYRRRRRTVPRPVKKAYNQMSIIMNENYPLTHRVASGRASFTVNWAHNTVGAIAADYASWPQCAEFAASSIFREFKVTYCKIAIDLTEF